MSQTTNEMYSVASYTADGATAEFVVPFPYLYTEDVHVYVNGVEKTVYPIISKAAPPSPYEVYWISESTLKFVSTPQSGASIEIIRVTNRSQPEVLFNNASILSEDDLNIITTQLLYIVQEAYDNFTRISIDIDSNVLQQMHTIQENTDKVVKLHAEAVAAATVADAGRMYVEETKDDAVTLLTETATSQVLRVSDEGEVQVNRIANMVNLAGIPDGVACAGYTWKLANDLAKGTEITLPESVAYVVGRKHLHFHYDGVHLSPTWVKEIGEVDTLSRKVSFNMSFKAGQELSVWVSPLGRAEVTEVIDRVKTLEDSFADLSRRVVYADSTSTTTTE